MAEIQRRVETGDMLHYMDDILIGSNSFDEMYTKLYRILQVLRTCGFTLNPTNVTEVRKFLGLSGYFRKFVAGYSIVSEPLRKLLRNDTAFAWGQQQESAFNELKTVLSSKPTMQVENGQLRPISYFSRSTTDNEKRLHSYELEALAIVESLERFKYYVYGKKIKVITDRKALRRTMEKRELIPRISRWWLRIQELDIEIQHRPGARMAHVDALSRAPYEEAHESYINSCVGCALNKTPGGRHEGRYHYDNAKPIPFTTIHINRLGPFPKSSKRNEHVLAIVDSFAKFTILRAAKSTAINHVIPVLLEITSYLGMPERIISDRGTAFTSKAFQKFWNENNVKHILNAVQTPRANRVILSIYIQWSINTIPNKTTGCTPFRLLYGYVSRDILQNQLIQALQEDDGDLINDTDLQLLRVDTAQPINDTYNEGDLVLTTNEPISSGTSRKLEPRFRGLFIITKVLPNDRYVIEDLPHAERTQRQYKAVFASDQLKTWCMLPPDDPDDIDDKDESTMGEGATLGQESRL
ncbi:uncharacterized protein LOC120781576 [Bactrocera tryoni]|nr:uncharacterized protein LOC120781576 [Bactrocera tryoni]